MYRYETFDRTAQNAYNDTYSNLVSPEKVNTLERNKKEKINLLSEINAVDSATYGLQNSYDQNNTYNSQNNDSFDQNSFSKNYSQTYETYSTFGDAQTKFSTPYKQEKSYFSSPEPTKTDYYKYESIRPIEEKGFSSTPNTKIYGTSDIYKNGSTDHQLMSYSNVEYVNDPPLISEIDSLEQRMCKQSITQKIIEKKTVHVSSSSKQESSTKSYRFE